MATFELKFSGVCVMVPLADERRGSLGVVMLMVNGRETPIGNRYSTLEAEPQLQPSPGILNRHRAFMKISGTDLDQSHLPSELVIDLHKMRVEVIPEGGPDRLTFADADDGLGAFEMEKVFEIMDAENNSPVPRVRSSCLATDPSEKVDPYIATQIFVSKGIVSDGYFAARNWWFERAVRGNEYVLKPAAEISVVIERATRLEVRIASFDNQQAKSYFFSRNARIEFLNLCDINPLRWPSSFAREEDEYEDLDFMWSYEILDADGTEWVMNHRFENGDMKFPIYPVRKEDGGGGGDNCRPIKFPPHLVRRSS